MNIINKTLGIFTVKNISYHDGQYYTYGGFGQYLSGIRKYFNKTILVAHVAEKEPEDGYYLIENEADNLEIVHLSQSRNELENLLQIPYNFVKAYSSVNRMDIVHNRMPDYTGVIGAMICNIKNIPYFVQIIADWEIEARKTPFYKKMGLGILLKLDYYFYDYLERIFSKDQLVFAQGYTCFEKHRNQADTQLVTSTAHANSDVVPFKERFVNNEMIRLLNVARLTGIKNQKLLVSAVAKLNKETQQTWTLDILGIGPLKQMIENQVNELGIEDKVFLRGQLNREEAFWEYYDESDVFVLSSRSEGTPKVLLEAMARSLPVVASDVGGISYLAPHKNRGLLFDDNSVDSLVNALINIKDNDELRNQMARNGIVFAKENTIENSTHYMVNKVKVKFGLD